MLTLPLQKPAARFLRTCLLIALYLCIFSDGEEAEWPPELLLTYKTVLRGLLCLLLFCVADLMKAALAKRVSGHFHTSLHFTKMQDALNKVRDMHAGMHAPDLAPIAAV